MNTRSKRRFLIVWIPFFVFIQLMVILYLAYSILSKGGTWSRYSLSPISKNNVQVGQSPTFDYFYEYVPNTPIIPSKDNEEDSGLGTVEAYTINADTLNERYNYQVNKPAETTRIITIGDSFTYGLGTNTDTNYPETLEDLLRANCKNQFDSINLGAVGYDISYAIEKFRIRGQKYNPDIVILFLKDDDFRDIKEGVGPIGKRYWKEYSEKPTTASALKATAESYREFSMIFNKQEQVDFFVSQLKKLNEYFKNDFIIITMPTFGNFGRSVVHQLMREVENVHFMDQLTDIYATGDHLPGGHPNTVGYQKIANDVFRYLIDTDLISCD